MVEFHNWQQGWCILRVKLDFSALCNILYEILELQQLTQLISCQRTWHNLQLPKQDIVLTQWSTNNANGNGSNQASLVSINYMYGQPYFSLDTSVLANFHPLVNDILLDATKSILCHIFTLRRKHGMYQKKHANVHFSMIWQMEDIRQRCTSGTTTCGDDSGLTDIMTWETCIRTWHPPKPTQELSYWRRQQDDVYWTILMYTTCFGDTCSIEKIYFLGLFLWRKDRDHALWKDRSGYCKQMTTVTIRGQHDW